MCLPRRRWCGRQPNHSRSWNAYKARLRPESRSRNDTAASWAVYIMDGWNGSRVVEDGYRSPRAASS
jgi:hypothetical protein